MAIFSVPNVKLSGIASAVPSQIAYNQDLDLIPEKEKKLFIRSVGINSRRVAPKGMCSSDLCYESAKRLLEELKWEAESVDVLVFVSQTPDYITPATAVILQDRLGLSKHCFAFDVNLGCSAYPYGLSVISSLLANKPNSRGLLLVGDISTACISQEDKSTVPIFSDGGSATALAYDAKAKPMWFNLQNDGSKKDAIIIPDGGFRNVTTKESLEYHDVSTGIRRRGVDMILEGLQVFNFSVTEAPVNIEGLLDEVGTNKDEVDHYILHQANKMINDSIAKKLGQEKDKFPSTLWDYGNTGSATIPLTLTVELGNALQKTPKQLLLCGFGVGVSWGSALVQTNGLVCPPLIEVE